jgi:hypothetical protein
MVRRGFPDAVRQDRVSELYLVDRPVDVELFRRGLQEQPPHASGDRDENNDFQQSAAPLDVVRGRNRCQRAHLNLVVAFVTGSHDLVCPAFLPLLKQGADPAPGALS